jgi:hypothetical protein
LLIIKDQKSYPVGVLRPDSEKQRYRKPCIGFISENKGQGDIFASLMQR